MTRDADVIVVGAGLSGLSAARALEVAGADVLVVEARDRVGGRTLTVPIGGVGFDVGAQWVGPDQPRVRAMAEGLGVERSPTPTAGTSLLDLDGETIEYQGTIPRLGLLDLVQLQRTIWALDRRARRLPTDDPGGVAPLDHTTLAAWEEERGLRAPVRGVIDAAMRVVFGAEPEDLSLWQCLAYTRSAGGLMPLVETEGGAQEDRLVGGTQQLARRLAANLPREPVCGAPVRAIDQRGADVVVTSDLGEHRADQVIVAVPPNLAADIAFEPPLPGATRTLLDGYEMGRTIKCIAVYGEPFWRDDGRSGEAVSTRAGPCSVVFDNTTSDGVPALLGFVVGEPANRWGDTDPARRRAAVLAQLARFFGPAALHPLHYGDHDWSSEAWSGGCPVALPRPGVRAEAGQDLLAPTGRVHWAGTETAKAWRGYLEGAVEAGERAARQALAQLEAIVG